MEFADLDINKEYTYADYLLWKFKERVELIKGKLFQMSPAPSRQHQEISGNLHFLLKGFLLNKPCRVYAAPFDVRIPQAGRVEVVTVVQPDLCVVCDENKLDQKGCVGRQT